MKSILLFIALACGVLLECTEAKAQAAGTLDASFGVGGVAEHQNIYSSSNEYCVLQTDGKIIVSAADSVYRFNTNGSLDLTFGVNGKSNFIAQFIRELIILPNNIIIIVHNSSQNTIAVSCLNANGMLNTAFGTNGTTLIGANIATSTFSYCGIREVGNKLLISGRAIFTNGVAGTIITRLNLNGSLDTSFGTNGSTNLVLSSFQRLYCIGIQSTGKIILAGDIINNTTSIEKSVIYRLNTNGTLDNSFANNGIDTLTLGNYSSIGSLCVLPDDKIIFAGYTTQQDILLFKCNANGGVDTNFGINGYKHLGATDVFPSLQGKLQVLQQPDGKIIFSRKGFIYRFLPNGSFDTTFGSNGSIAIASSDPIKSVLQPDGKILCAYSNNNNYLVLSRYNTGITATDPIRILTNISVFPNPLQSNTQITYDILKSAPVSIVMYNILGEQVANFITNSPREAGEHTETLNIPEMPSGIYLITINTPNGSKSIRVVKQ